MGHCFLIIFLVFFSSSSFGALSVVPGRISPSDSAWLESAIASEATGAAAVSKPVYSTMTTSQGTKIILPSQWAASIPRGTLASSAASVLKRAGVAGIAAYGLYQLLSPLIGLNQDGTVTTTTPPTARDSCYAEAVAQSTAGGYAYCSPTRPDNGYTSGNQFYQCHSNPNTTCYWVWQNQYPKAGYGTPTTSTGPVSESDLSSKIQNSSAANVPLLQNTIRDARLSQGPNISFGLDANAASVSASPVVGPQETVKTTTTPNPDGSTSTTTETEQTTATPTTGPVTGDAIAEWKTATERRRQTVNNTSGQTQLEISTENQGTSTTQAQTQQTDLCKDHPNISACAELGTSPTDTPPAIASASIAMSYTPPSSVAGSCPADTVSTLRDGHQVSYSWAPACTFASGVRGAVLASAGLGALLIMFGFRASESA